MDMFAVIPKFSGFVPVLCLLAALVLVKAAMGPTRSRLQVKRRPLMTKVEAETLHYLETSFPQVRVHAQVAMSALIEPASGLSPKGRTWMLRRFNQKVVDFVLQDRRTGEVRVLVELDDRTHSAEKDRERDKITAAGGYRTVRLSGRARPTRTSVASAVGPMLD